MSPDSTPSDEVEFPADLGEGVEGELQLVAGVRRRDDGPDPGAIAGHRRLGDMAASTYVIGKADAGRPVPVRPR